ncbi:hypothetical protein JOF28_001410 [Leucobacter exalbidus]|uniref:Ankyrin repeat domain-containing protein n=1 Tax=Leucobacter exalbidus TaxID=662960 RepID=A0A940T3U8_9MICO|nr:ankyrin repeat domain-containing protein [Leucobacter exalbidus]MBP1326178.1 hypothetical protein [Leucobacter exalbidus]
MARKRKTLPKEFGEMLTSAPLDELIAVFDQCEINARGTYPKSTALGFRNCPDALIVWLVEHGIDLEARDVRGCTALADRAQSSSQKHADQIALLISLGADIEAPDSSGRTPFWNATTDLRPAAARVLAQHGAQVTGDTWDPEQLLTIALSRVDNISIEAAVEISRLLIELGAPVTEQMRASVAQIGQVFERYRSVFAPDQLDATQAALDELYSIFDVAPASTRVMHDGSSPIVIADGTWQHQHEALWELLVPGAGPAATEQGEVIRLTGKVADEMFRNGGGNWNASFRGMVDSFVALVGTRAELSPAHLADARAAAQRVRTGRGEQPDLYRLSELAVEWVSQNPQPHPLSTES